MTLIAGVDEAGRGPLAGPVYAAAVIFPEDFEIFYVKDSKKISEKKRDIYFDWVIENALSYCIAKADVAEIDELNIHHATLLAMKRAVMGLSHPPQEVLIDGIFAPELPYQVKTIVGGDESNSIIACASILAKVTRDRELIALDKQYPQYGFAKHKGYGTAMHLKTLKQFGISPIHRKSFAPVRELLTDLSLCGIEE